MYSELDYEAFSCGQIMLTPGVFFHVAFERRLTRNDRIQLVDEKGEEGEETNSSTQYPIGR